MAGSFQQFKFRCVRCGHEFWVTVKEHPAIQRCKRCRTTKENKEIDNLVKRELAKFERKHK